mmetsp:Transcript_47608/g.111333  ORF Transcript_47608/g.111333 Transcript_47608/m.111333 type:complete len:236 (+) Transcript_47608:65-772(+)
MAIQLPVEKREARNYDCFGAAPRPQTPETRSPSAVSMETFGDGRDTEEASTPRNLWPATPSPSPKYCDVSFMLPPLVSGPCPELMVYPETENRKQLNVHAKAFVPSFGSPPPERFQLPVEAEAATTAVAGAAPPLHDAEPDVALASAGGSTPETPNISAIDVPTLEIPNLGSAMHASGGCKPCAWFWKSRGCANGYACDYCHLCPAGALKERKKAKVAAIRSGVLAPRGPTRDRN